jgi:hypothetical protein
MRIIYDNGAIHIGNSINPLNGRTKSETVLVISSERVSSGEGSSSGGAYDVKISGEAVARDSEVRSHEKAHLASLGSAAASGVIYDTVKGPDGETIAVGGRIAVDLAEVPGDPEATLRKARSVINAANAPGNPSAGDMRTAAKAYAIVQKAQEQINRTFDLEA